MAGNILAISDFYKTAPWGFRSVHPFLNTAIHLDTSLSPQALLVVTQQIEHELGRNSKSRNLPNKEVKPCHVEAATTVAYTDRPIDIDILLYDNLILQSPDLILPHPLMHQRMFVLQPLSEIAPNLRHPVLNKTMTALCQELSSI